MIPIIEENIFKGYKIIGEVEEDLKKEFKIVDKQIEVEEKYYNSGFTERKREEFEFIREIEKEMPEEIIAVKRRLKEELTQRYVEIIESYEKSIWKGNPLWLVQCIKEINNPEKILKQIKKLQTDIDFLEGKKHFKEGEITERDIIKARDYPFENLIEVKRNFTECPFHNEKTGSFYIKKNFGYCFGCGWSGDTIKFIMETKSLNFIEAVKLLR